jgi:3'(2'), 5'-bisphosphate nucleotidase
MTAVDSLLEPAIDAVEAAMVVCRHVQRELEELRAMTKDDRSPVTIADFASQGVVATALAERLGGFGSLRLVGEESAEFLRQDEHASHLAACLTALRDADVWPDVTASELLDAIDAGAAEPASGPDDGFWTLDPIDGTKGFLRGGQYCVSLAYIRAGIVELGVLGCPNLGPDGAPETVSRNGTLYSAIRGDGAMMQWASGEMIVETNIEREDVDEADPARLAESVETAHTRQDLSGQIMRLAGGGSAGTPKPSYHVDSQAKYALVARGDADVYLRLPSKKAYVERIWDHAAGMLIAQEAGCVVTDIRGKPLDFSHGKGLEVNSGIVGAPPKLHARLLQAIEKLRVGVE